MSEARKRRIYDSCRIVSPRGELMCLVAEKRARWYLARGLASVVSETPLTVALNFEPKGLGHAGDLFYTTARPNVCAGCGAEESLTLHHIVPYCYRRHFPPEVKDHSCHDLAPLCLDCHTRYELSAAQLKRDLAEEYGAPLPGNGWPYDAGGAKAKKAASALARHGRGDFRIPEARLLQLRRVVSAYFNAATVDDTLIAKACALDPHVEEEGSQAYAQMVTAVSDLQAFVERWRRHFVSTLYPLFLPEGWRIDREVGQ